MIAYIPDHDDAKILARTDVYSADRILEVKRNYRAAITEQVTATTVARTTSVAAANWIAVDHGNRAFSWAG